MGCLWAKWLGKGRKGERGRWRDRKRKSDSADERERERERARAREIEATLGTEVFVWEISLANG